MVDRLERDLWASATVNTSPENIPDSEDDSLPRTEIPGMDDDAKTMD